jgi:hypothetical protein
MLVRSVSGSSTITRRDAGRAAAELVLLPPVEQCLGERLPEGRQRDPRQALSSGGDGRGAR